MLIRSLDSATDRALVDAFFIASTDYVMMERDQAPGPEVTQEFFTDAPPGCDPTRSLRLGMVASDPHAGLSGLAELAFGYPAAQDAYIGLMMIAPSARGTGAGGVLLRHLETQARARGMTHIYLAVLDANPRGRAFWERQGFTLALPNRPVTLGRKTQNAHRLGKAL